MDRATIAKVQAFGFDVWMRNLERDTYLWFTDGTRIGYLQEGAGGFTLCTVHKPNHTSGTGYQIARDVGDFTKADLVRCFAAQPHWAYASEAKSVVKYRGMAHFTSADLFHRDVFPVAPIKES